jgi:hypothetical protein
MAKLANNSLAASASEELLANLPIIARRMMEPTRTERTKGKTVKRKTKNGWSYTYVMNPLSNSVGLSQIHVRSLRELGALLCRIAACEDARKLFRQNERTKPVKGSDHHTRALAYWSIRALDPAVGDTRAMRKANAVIPRSKDLSNSTIRKIAQKYRDRSMWLLAWMSTLVRRPNNRVSRRRF